MNQNTTYGINIKGIDAIKYSIASYKQSIKNSAFKLKKEDIERNIKGPEAQAALFNMSNTISKQIEELLSYLDVLDKNLDRVKNNYMAQDSKSSVAFATAASNIKNIKS